MALWNRNEPKPGEIATPDATVLLRIDPEVNRLEEGKELRDGLSAIIQVGPHLWTASDETAALERFTRLEDGSFGEHRSFPLNRYLSLPGEEGEEVDVEGMAWAPPYLWLVGSHSLKRKKPGSGDDPRERIKRLARVSGETNRYLLARVPLVDDGEGGLMPVKKTEDGKHTAARLRGDGVSQQLMKALAEDKHFRDFLTIPGKDNGFDVEGLTAMGSRLFLGLRGPVLRGWAAVLEVETQEEGGGELSLRPLGKKGRPYLKHFLDLGGLGVREVKAEGDDLLILAGPTLDLDGPVEVFRWLCNAPSEEDRIVDRGDTLKRILHVPYGVGEEEGLEHAEGMTLFREGDGPPRLLLVYDAPAPRRKVGEAGLLCDVFTLPRP
jgi:hypothetical protein